MLIFFVSGTCADILTCSELSYRGDASGARGHQPSYLLPTHPFIQPSTNTVQAKNSSGYVSSSGRASPKHKERTFTVKRQTLFHAKPNSSFCTARLSSCLSSCSVYSFMRASHTCVAFLTILSQILENSTLPSRKFRKPPQGLAHIS